MSFIFLIDETATASPPQGTVVAWGDNAYGETDVPSGLTNAVAVAPGGYFSVGLLSQGAVVAWGDNTYGETDVPVGLTNVVAISAGGYDALALLKKGTVVAWGNSFYGETNVPAGLTNVLAISAGLYHCLALLGNGTVTGWGYNGDGEINVPIGLTNVVAIAAGGYHSLALLANGTVTSWGNNPYADTSVPAGLTNVVAIAAGAYHCLALLGNGSVVAWGDNTFGETTVPAGLTNVTAIAGEFADSQALLGNGTVVTWGDNTYGETSVPLSVANVLSLGQNSSGDHSLVIVGPGTAPAIVTQPVSQTVAVGTNVTFSVTATGTPPLAYQWFLNGTNLMGQTNSLLNLTNVQAGNVGYYTVAVSNDAGTATSTNAALGLTFSTTFTYNGQLQTFTVPPGINQISVTITGAQGAAGGTDSHPGGSMSAQLQAIANLAVIPSSQLIISVGQAGVGGTGCANNPGGAGGYSPLSGYAGGNGGAAGPYGCSGSGGGGGAATLIVMPDGGSIVVGGGGGAGGGGNNSPGINGIASILVGATNYVTVGGGGASHPSDGGGGGGGGGGAVGGAGGGVMANCDCGAYPGTAGGSWLPTNYLAPSFVWMTNYGNFGGNGSITISSAYVPTPPSITSLPVNFTVAEGGNASFAVTAISATPLSFQWQLNGTNLINNANFSGSQSSNLTVTGVNLADAGVYQVIVSNIYGSSSATDSLTVQAIPVVTWVPKPVTYGTALTASQLDATVSVPGTNVYAPVVGAVLDAGNQMLSLVFTPSSVDNTNYITYLSTTDTVNLAVASAPLVVTASNATRVYGQANPNFGGTITGVVNGDVITANYSSGAIDISPPGQYAIIPSLVDPGNRLGNYNVTSNNGILTVTPGAPPTLTGVSPSMGYTTGGTPVTIAGTGFESGAGITIGGQPATSVMVNSGTQITAVTPAGRLGAANLILINPDGNSFTLTNGFVYQGVPPYVVSQPASQTVPSGSNVVFSVTVGGAAPLSFQWYFNGASLAGQTNTTLSLTNAQPANIGNYQVMVSNPFGVTNSASGYLHLGTVVNFATGQNAAGQIQTTGDALDANWTLVSGGNAPLDPPNLYVVTATQPDWYSGWLPDSTNSCWIAPNPDNGNANGDYVSSYTFNLTGDDLTTAQFTGGYWTIDDSGYIQLNGNFIASLGGYNWGNLNAFSLPLADLVAGTNILTIYSINSDNYLEGFRCEGVLTVAELVGPPTVAQQSQTTSAVFGTSVSLNVSASGPLPLSYQWQFNGTNLVDNGQTTGVQSNVLTLANVTMAQAGIYNVVVTNAFGSTNAVVALTVLPATPVVSWTNPVAITYGTALSSNQLNATANVPGNYFYNPETGAVLSAGSQTLTVGFTPTDITDYLSVTTSVSLVVSPASLSVTASNATRPYGQANPTFTGSIVGLVNGDSITATYGCSAVSFSAPGAYPIIPSLVDPNNRQGDYSIALTNGTLTVTPGAPPTITSIQPNSSVTNQQISVTINGTGFELGAGVSIGNQPATSVSVNSGTQITAVTPTGSLGAASVVVHNPDGTSATLPNGFTYFGLPPSILTQPASQLLVIQGSNTQFQVTAQYAAGYQWRFNNANLSDTGGISGAHSGTLAVSDVQNGNVGNYQVVVTNAYGAVTSSVAILSLLHTNPPVIFAVSASPSIQGCVITWQTDVPAYDQVAYGTSTNYAATNALSGTVVTNHSVTLSGLTPNTLYHFDILVFDANESQSGDLTFTTLPDTIPPVASIFSVPATLCSLPYTFDWTGSDLVTPTTNLVFAYQLDNQGWSAFGPATSVAVSQLADGQHTFSVEARDAADNISSPASASFYLDTTAPVISSVTASPGDDYCVINWLTAKPASGSVNYGSTTGYGQSGPSSPSGTTHSITLSGLQATTAYHFQVTAEDACGRQVVSADAQFTTLAAPDLQVANVTAPTNVWTGNGFLVSWVDTNAGPGVANGSWVDAVYLSLTNQLNPRTDLLLGQFPLTGPLNPGQGVQLSQLVTLGETGVPSGYYYISVVTDAGNAVYEVTKTNNVGIIATNLYVNETPLPALSVTAVNAPTNAQGNASVTVSWTVCNQGTGATDVPLWYDHLYLSSTTNLNGVIQDYGTYANPGYLVAGDCYDQSATVTLPAGISGNYYFIVKADSTGLLTQETMTGNVGTTTVPINIQLVTLGFLHTVSVLVDPAPPTVTEPGAPITCTYVVENIGDSPITGSWDDRITLSAVSNYANDLTTQFAYENDINVGGPLLPGASYTNTATFTLPATVAGLNVVGKWYVVPVVDIHLRAGGPGIGVGQIVGRDEVSQLIDVGTALPAQLAVTAVSAPTNAAQAQTINVQWIVANQGVNQTSASSWYDGVYLTTNVSFTFSQSILVGSSTHFGALDIGASYSANFGVVIPTNILTAGQSNATNYIFVVADVGGAVNEETSNLVVGAAIPIVISQTPPPADLAVIQVQAPGAAGLGAGPSIGTLVAGSTVIVSWSVTNLGAGFTSVSNWTDSVYLSPTPALNPATEILLLQSTHNGYLAPRQFYTQHQGITLPDCFSGNYYFIVVADSGLQVTGDGANNVLATATTSYIWPSEVAHLEVTAVNPPASGQAGAALPVTWTIQNLGNATTNAPWLDSLYLSPTPQFEPGNSILLGIYPHPQQIGSHATYTESKSPEIPPCDSGSYYVVVATDTGDVVNGIGCYTNNVLVSAMPVKILPANYARLQVSGVQAPMIVTSGTPWNISWAVTNSGTGAAIGSWTDAIYASELTTLDASALLLGQVTHTNMLAPGGSYTQTNRFAFAPCFSGNYNLLVVADVSNVVNVLSCLGSSQNLASTPVLVNSGLYPDLVVTAIANPASGTAGQSLAISWSVTNNGLGAATGPWTDSVYLTTSPTFASNTSVLLGAYPQTAAIPAGGGYTQSTSFALPNIIGNFYVVVVIDSRNAIQQCQPSANNIYYSPTVVGVPATLYPDLKVTSVHVPASSYSGQSIIVSWVVTNEGTEATPTSIWNDALYLSLDQVLNPNNVRFGSYPAPTGLAVGQSYTNTAMVAIPAGLAGPYYILGVADSGGALFEHLGYNDSLGFNSTPMVVVLPPPADLVATSATVSPGSGVFGTPITINWNVFNNSSNTIPAAWTDAVYLSTNAVWDLTATEVATVNHSGLAANSGYNGSWSGSLPALTPGSYYAIVKTDVRDTVNELTLTNNSVTSSGTISVDVPVITLGQPVTNQLATGAAQYYKFTAPAGATVAVSLAGSYTNAANELYVRYGAVPDLGNYDYLYSNPLSAKQQITIPTTSAGWYFIMVRGGNEPNGPLGYTLEANVVPLAINSISATQIGHNGQVTLTLTGAKFESGATVQLISGTNVYSAATNMLLDATSISSRFLFTNAVDGVYNVVLTNPDNTSTSDPHAVTIEPAIPLAAEVIPGLVNAFPREGLPFYWSGSVYNAGNVDIQYLTVTVADDSGFPIALTPPSQTAVADVNSTDNSQNICMFISRNLAVGASANLSFVISGFGTSGFYYYVVPTAQSTADFLSQLVGEGESVRELALSEVGAYSTLTTNTSGVVVSNSYNFPTGMIAALASTNQWEYTFAKYAVAGGLLDESALNSLPPPTNASIASVYFKNPKDLAGCLSDCAANAQIDNAAAYAACLICIAASWETIAGPALCVAAQATADAAIIAHYNVCVNGCKRDNPCNGSGKALAIRKIAFKANSAHETPPTGPTGPTCPIGGGDPNELEGPKGYGPSAFVGIQTPWVYTIYFENESNATAFASQITVTNTVPNSLDINTFRVGQIVLGDVTVTVPTNRTFVQIRVPAPSPNPTNVVVDITAGVDVLNNKVFWTMNAIDLNTGQLVTEGDEGVLPQNKTNNIGQGYVVYSILPKAGVTTGTVVTNQSSIVFDINDPIATNPTTNTVDAVPPTSSVAALPAVELSTNLVITWSGLDDTNGSGVADYDIYFSDNNGPWQNLLSDTTTNSTTFAGQPGHYYGFYSVAEDNAGNYELKTPANEAYTFISSNQPPVLAPIANQMVNVGGSYHIIEATTNTGGAGETLTYTLLNAPEGVTINRTNGTIYWNPQPYQAVTTNLITVQVSNNGIPPLSASESFLAIVGEYAALDLGSDGVQAGQTVCVPLTLISTASLTNLNFTLAYPANQLGGLSLTPLVSQIASLQTVPLDASHAQISLQTQPGTSLAGTQQVASLCFTGLTNRQSSVATVVLNFSNAIAVDGTTPGTLAGSSGTIVVLQNRPYVTLTATGQGQFALNLYGTPGATYNLESSSSLSGPWTAINTFKLSGISQSVTVNNQAASAMFFRMVLQ